MPPQTRLQRKLAKLHALLDEIERTQSADPADLETARAFADAAGALPVSTIGPRDRLPFRADGALDVRAALVEYVRTHDPALAAALRRRGFNLKKDG